MALSESRNLIQDILQKDVAHRLTIPQILAHPWFAARQPNYGTSSTFLEPSPTSGNKETAVDHPQHIYDDPVSSKSNSSSEISKSIPATPNDDPFGYSPPLPNLSETSINKTSADSKMGHTAANGRQPETVQEEEVSVRVPLRHNSSSSSKAPPPHPLRTPARTKRRSVSSTLDDDDPASPTAEKTPLTPLPLPFSRDIDFVSLMSTPAPIIFSTPHERQLLNALSMLGFDTAQIVHSVLSNACDAAGAVWWMLKKQAEKKQAEEGNELLFISPSLPDTPVKSSGQKSAKKRKTSVGTQTDSGGLNSGLARSAPQLAFVPPTPTFQQPMTPPRPTTPTRSAMLSPLDASSKSHPSTPAGSLKDKDSKGRKVRSGSVSIMQRATTALEAAGLVKKKSTEAVREERDKSKEAEKRVGSGEEPRSSYGSGGSSKSTKSPTIKSLKDHPPSTPPPFDLAQAQMGSPWVLAETRASISHPHRLAAPTPANTPGDNIPSSISTPTFSESTNEKAKGPPQRNRASLLQSFRIWFNEDRKGKRKESPASSAGVGQLGMHSRPLGNVNQVFNSGTAKRRGSNAGKVMSRGHRQRHSASSRRSSSVNSRRSSGASLHKLIVDSPQIAARSFGSHTPNSERGDHSSRPSSIQSFTMQHRHKKSPSQSSVGSVGLRATSPMKYHRRAGSGSSTRVVRQVQPTSRPAHARSNSATSSLYSAPSSRPTSFYEASENEGPRTSSPFRPRATSMSEDTGRPFTAINTTFVAQKRQAPFASPVTHHSHSRSSWKKSWGLEPPGWQSRTKHLPVEVLDLVCD